LLILYIVFLKFLDQNLISIFELFLLLLDLDYKRVY